MSPLSELWCWVYGTLALFGVKISNSETVAHLKHVISESKKPVGFTRIDPNRLDLYLIPRPCEATLATMLDRWIPEGKQALDPQQDLSSFELSESLVVIIPHHQLAEMTIICYEWGRGLRHTALFPVDISPKEYVHALKETIKNKLAFDHIDACQLRLYRLSDPTPATFDKAVRTIDFNQPMGGFLRLAQYFPIPPPEGRIHVVVDVPGSYVAGADLETFLRDQQSMQQQAEADASLFAEIDRLSSLWEGLQIDR